MPGGGNGGGSQPSGTTTTVQKSDPWAGQQPFLNLGFNQASVLGSPNGGPQYFPGQTYAQPTDAQNQAINSQEALGSAGSPLTAPATLTAMSRLDPSYLTSNPGNQYFQGMASGNSPAINAAVANATPGLLDTFTQGNRLNSPGAAYAVSQGIANAAAPYTLSGAQGLSQNYSNAAQQQNQALLLSPSLQQMPYTDLSQLYNAGQTQQALGQQNINDQVARWNYQQTQPYNLENWYMNAIQGNYGGTSSLTTPYFQQPTGGFGGALTGALGGAALGNQFGMPYLGAGAGGLLGGLF